jgi:hypothetical protein
MILDYKKFENIKNSKKQAKGILYMMEQTPSRIVYHDISKYLFNHQFFGSFNRAFLQKTKESLHVALIKYLYGKRFGYRGSERGKIMDEIQKKVVDLKSLKDLLRYNGYKANNFYNDPSSTHPGEGISARYDLEKFMKNLSGGIDCKVTNLELVNNMSAIAISGPTNENNKNLSSFDWSKSSDHKTLRKGVPEKFDFPYLLVSPKTLCCDNTNDIYTFK